MAAILFVRFRLRCQTERSVTFVNSSVWKKFSPPGNKGPIHYLMCEIYIATSIMMNSDKIMLTHIKAQCGRNEIRSIQ